MARDYKQELEGTVIDLHCDFDPEYLETQLAIIDNQKELEWLAQVLIHQLKRETETTAMQHDQLRRYEKELRSIGRIVEEYIIQ